MEKHKGSLPQPEMVLMVHSVSGYAIVEFIEETADDPDEIEPERPIEGPVDD